MPENHPQSKPGDRPAYLDDLFYLELPQPPLGRFDSCYPAWAKAMEAAAHRDCVCKPSGSQTPECIEARRAYYEVVLLYGDCMMRCYGSFFSPEAQRFFKKGRP